MPHPRQRIAFAVAAFICIGWILLASVWPDGGPYDAIGIGIVLGTMLGHTTIASAWTALGPGAIAMRMPLSLIWLASLSVVFMINAGLHEGVHAGLFIVISASLLAQWALVQLPLWALAVRYGLWLQHRDQANQPLDPRSRQFGIRQVMLLTFCVAVLLGIGRLMFMRVEVLTEEGMWAPFLFIAGAAVVFTVPLLLAALLPRYTVLAVVFVLSLIGLATAWEFNLLSTLHAGSPATSADFAWINVVSSVWVLAFVVAVRLCGFGLAQPPVANAATAS